MLNDDANALHVDLSISYDELKRRFFFIEQAGMRHSGDDGSHTITTPSGDTVVLHLALGGGGAAGTSQSSSPQHVEKLSHCCIHCGSRFDPVRAVRSDLLHCAQCGAHHIRGVDPASMDGHHHEGMIRDASYPSNQQAGAVRSQGRSVSSGMLTTLFLAGLITEYERAQFVGESETQTDQAVPRSGNESGNVELSAAPQMQLDQSTNGGLAAGAPRPSRIGAVSAPPAGIALSAASASTAGDLVERIRSIRSRSGEGPPPHVSAEAGAPVPSSENVSLPLAAAAAEEIAVLKKEIDEHLSQLSGKATTIRQLQHSLQEAQDLNNALSSQLDATKAQHKAEVEVLKTSQLAKDLDVEAAFKAQIARLEEEKKHLEREVFLQREKAAEYREQLQEVRRNSVSMSASAMAAWNSLLDDCRSGIVVGGGMGPKKGR